MATTTPNYGLSKPAGTDPVDISVLNGNTDIIDTALHELDEGKADQSALDELETEVEGKQDQLTFDTTPTADSNNPVTSGGVQAEFAKRNVTTMGTAIVDPDPDNGVYADLFTLPIGKYNRQSNVTRVRNIPADLTAVFYCEVVNTISNLRRQIRLYPCTAATAGTFYTCLETANGYGAWYKFSGEAVT